MVRPDDFLRDAPRGPPVFKGNRHLLCYQLSPLGGTLDKGDATPCAGSGQGLAKAGQVGENRLRPHLCPTRLIIWE